MLCNGCCSPIIAHCCNGCIIAHLSMLLCPLLSPTCQYCGCCHVGFVFREITVVAMVTDFVYILGQGHTHSKGQTHNNKGQGQILVPVVPARSDCGATVALRCQ